MNMMTGNSLPSPEWGHGDTGRAGDNGTCYIDYTREQLERMWRGERIGGGPEPKNMGKHRAKEIRAELLERLRKGPAMNSELLGRFGTRYMEDIMRLRKRGCVIKTHYHSRPEGNKGPRRVTYMLISDENYTE